MLLFNTNQFKVYNYIIHHFLEIEIFNEDEDLDIGDKLEIIYLNICSENNIISA